MLKRYVKSLNYFEKLKEYERITLFEKWRNIHLGIAALAGGDEYLNTTIFQPTLIVSNHRGLLFPARKEKPLRLVLVDDKQLPLRSKAINTCVLFYTLDFSPYPIAEKVIYEAMRVSRKYILIYLGLPFEDTAVKAVRDPKFPKALKFQYSRAWLRTRLGSFAIRQRGDDTIITKTLSE